MREHRLKRSLQEVVEVVDRFTANWFLIAGSCLGYLRHGRAIDWDHDIDIGIYDPGIDLRGLAKRLLVDRFYGIGTRVTEASIFLERQRAVDVYLLFDHDGCVAQTLHNVPRKEVKLLIYPKEIFEGGVERVTFCGVGCNALKRSHEYCRAVYGDSYLIPDPLYDWWEGPRNAVIMNSEPMFTEDAPGWSVWDKLRRYWRQGIIAVPRWCQGVITIARRRLRRLGGLLASGSLLSRHRRW